MDKKEQIKIGLLAFIAGTLIIQTFIQSGILSLKHDTSLTHTHDTAKNNNILPQIQQQQDIPPRNPNVPLTSIEFKENAWDFGKIKQNTTNNMHIFKFTNTGTNPLIIENAIGSCGCTVPKWPKEPILPGATGDIEVDFKPGKQNGSQQKSVTIMANTEPREIRLSISAIVEEVLDK